MVMNHGLFGFWYRLCVLSVVLIITACSSAGKQQPAAKIDPSIIAVSTPGVEIPRGAKFAWLSKAVNLYRDERLDSVAAQMAGSLLWDAMVEGIAPTPVRIGGAVLALAGAWLVSIG